MILPKAQVCTAWEAMLLGCGAPGGTLGVLERPGPTGLMVWGGQKGGPGPELSLVGRPTSGVRICVSKGRQVSWSRRWANGL